MTHLDTDDKIAAAQIAIWTPLLLGALYLCLRHSFAKTSGWLFLLLLSLARLIGASLRLATLSSPTNQSLYVGWAICSGIGSAMLVSVNIGLMGRLLRDVQFAGHQTIIKPFMQTGLQLVQLVAVVLFIVGGSQADYTLNSSGGYKIDYPTLSKVGLALFLLVLFASVLTAIYLFFIRRHIPSGETRILAAVGLSLPFVILRLAYACALIYGTDTPSVWVALALEVITEMIAAVIIEVMGFTLKKEVVPSPAEEEVDVEMNGQKNQGVESMNGPAVAGPRAQQGRGHGRGQGRQSFRPRGPISYLIHLIRERRSQ